MKRFSLYLLLSVVFVGFMACGRNTTQPNVEESVVSDLKLGVYYFHYSERSDTCIAIEKLVKEVLDEFYTVDIDSGKILYASLNLDEEEGANFAREFQLTGQALMFASADEYLNLTEEAKSYIFSDPDKLKELFKETINKALADE